MAFETVIGLEIHAQLKTESKIFCACSTQFGQEPNQNTCEVCLGLPGTLPVLNKLAVEYAVKAGLATHCQIATKSVFARKNYFYPDLPKGYQISQLERPLCEHGYQDIETSQGTKRVGITRIHMEEDAGKLLHEHPQTRASGASWVDLNRAGTPLVEIVSEPDMRSAEEAVAYLKQIRNIVRYINICDGNMEEGSLRCDANVSIRPVGQKEFGTRTELKNINSFKNVEKAILYEVERQKDVIESGGTIVQETRLWDADKNVSKSMRSKEEANDYRYFPDPDLLPLVISQESIDKIQAALPELQVAKAKRFVSDYGLSDTDAKNLTQSQGLANFFENAAKIYGDGKQVSNWLLSEVLRELNTANIEIEDSPLTPENLAALLKLVDEGVISRKIAKEIFPKVFAGEAPHAVVESQGLKQVSDTGSLEPIIDQIIADNPTEAERFRGGDQKLMGFFVGQVMKQTQGQANPKLVNELIRKKLS